MSEKGFIETVDTILRERNELINKKAEQEVELKNSIKSLNIELDKAKTEYSNKFTDESLSNVKEISRQIKEKELELEDIREDIGILKGANHIEYSPENILQEVDQVVTDSNLLREIEEANQLALSLKAKYQSIADNWETLRWNIHKFSARVNKLKLTYRQRERLVNSIENKSDEVYQEVKQCHEDIKKSAWELPWTPAYGMHLLNDNPYERKEG